MRDAEIRGCGIGLLADREGNSNGGAGLVKTVGVEFFCYHRDRPGSVPLRDELLEEHWSYMDRAGTS